MLTAIHHPTLTALEARIERLHDEERLAQRALGEAILEGHPGAVARQQLARIRGDLEGAHAAARLLELDVPSPFA